MLINDDKISPLSEAEEALFYKFNPLSKERTNFEDSYEYIRLYFDAGEWRGSRFFDGESLLFFARAGSEDKPDTVRYKIAKPLGAEPVVKLTSLVERLRGVTTQSITIVCLPAAVANQLEGFRKKQFRYLVYETAGLADLKGQHWKSVRQKITKFKREHGQVRIEKLNESNSTKVVHLIADWRRSALHERGHSYTQIDKAKFAARYYADKIDGKNLWGNVYFIEGRAAAFQFLYRVGANAAANPIGITDISIDGLAEYSQVHSWREAAESGIKYINDGPSWRKSLEQFKRKFNPVEEQLVVECYI